METAVKTFRDFRGTGYSKLGTVTATATALDLPPRIGSSLYGNVCFAWLKNIFASKSPEYFHLGGTRARPFRDSSIRQRLSRDSHQSLIAHRFFSIIFIGRFSFFTGNNKLQRQWILRDRDATAAKPDRASIFLKLYEFVTFIPLTFTKRIPLAISLQFLQKSSLAYERNLLDVHFDDIP